MSRQPWNRISPPLRPCRSRGRAKPCYSCVQEDEQPGRTGALACCDDAENARSSIMRNVLIVLTAAAALVAAATPAAADGSRRAWRGSPYGVGAISRNVITPYYFGYYPGHYSYFAPDPVPP